MLDDFDKHLRKKSLTRLTDAIEKFETDKRQEVLESVLLNACWNIIELHRSLNHLEDSIKILSAKLENK